jgi:paraquat-inducible protein A
VISLGKGTPDTILSGVEELAHAGMWPLALLVFFASVTVPMLKLIGLIVMLVATGMGSRRRLRDRTVLYRIVEFVGRWSMIDVFMISILVGLVQLGNLATIEPGIGAVSFASVVILTMLAAESFDPRLMWDAAEAAGGSES